MNEQTLTQMFQALATGQSPPALSPEQLAAELLRRDQRRVRWLAGLGILFWLIGIGGLVLLLIGLDRFVIFVRISDVVASPQDPAHGPGKLLSAEQINRLHGTNLLHHSIPWVAGSLGALLIASLCTVLLIFSSRTATLRQINLSLLTLCRQLEKMQQAAADS
jgi:hypothetical protein